MSEPNEHSTLEARRYRERREQQGGFGGFGGPKWEARVVEVLAGEEPPAGAVLVTDDTMPHDWREEA